MSPITLKHGSRGHWALRIGGVVAIIVLIWWVSTQGSNGLIEDFSNALVLAVAAMALNLVLGYSGMISIGHSAFFGVGSYATGVLIVRHGWNPWLTFVVGFVVAFLVGMLVSLPALRIKGIYLALVTLSLALLFPNLVKWKKLSWLTGGSVGLDKTTFSPKMRRWKIFGWDPFGDLRRPDGRVPFFLWIILVLAVITYFVCRGLVKSRVGRSMVAMRDNETAAAVMGVPIARTKALVFGVSAGLTSFGGSWAALKTGNVAPNDVGSMSLQGAIIFLVAMVVGGAGTLWGPIVGAFAYTMLASVMSSWADDAQIPGLFRPLLGWSKISPSTGVFALALVVLMFVAPYGLVGLWNRLAAKVVRIIPAPAGTARTDEPVGLPSTPLEDEQASINSQGEL